MKPHILSLLASFVVCGCALTTKGEALEVRTFSPELPMPLAGPAPRASFARPPVLRLGRISSAAHLRKRIVFRRSAVEVGVYDDLRWAELPEEYARRAVGRALFQERGLRQSLEGPTPILDVEVLAFEEVRTETGAAGRVTLRYTLHDETSVLATETFGADEPASSKKPEDVTRAVAIALGRATGQLADAVAKRLEAQLQTQ